MEWSYPVDYGDELVKDLLSQFNNSTPMGDPQVPDGQPQPTQVPHETQPETFQQAQFDATRNVQSRSYDTQPGGDEGAQPESFQPVQPEGQLQNALQLSATSEQAQQPEIRLVAVEVPKLENSEEYEYLPGHFDVRYIINEKWDEEGEAMYTVRLRSGELQTVSLELWLLLGSDMLTPRALPNRFPRYSSNSLIKGQWPSNIFASMVQRRKAKSKVDPRTQFMIRVLTPTCDVPDVPHGPDVKLQISLA